MHSDDLADLVPQLLADKEARRADNDARLADEVLRRAEGRDRDQGLRDGATALRDDIESTIDDLRLNRKLDAAERAEQRRLDAAQRRAQVAETLKSHAEDRRNATGLWQAAFGRKG